MNTFPLILPILDKKEWAGSHWDFYVQTAFVIGRKPEDKENSGEGAQDFIGRTPMTKEDIREKLPSGAVECRTTEDFPIAPNIPQRENKSRCVHVETGLWRRCRERREVASAGVCKAAGFEGGDGV
ncbi:hypothetical protein NDU88_003039 [Pleurodeles waltl]|uniref:Uncharacterized protein n=1 Tax=Pleurodeles waltl TaxID=8319 RepID=A0AAV7P8V9_PLEWA|nr:hypothetical protein NDU88_003039 [Pleurodeles waltl]